ncbi:MAG: type III-A CRISPR-associated RAMP protein Csm5 [Propionivibrio sp.]|nr:type III-A CRISPR-associated RAMP protein Csm5 [Propionivibrio sp.]
MITNTRALAISTLSPIHIGCDEVYEPSNFVIHDGLLHALDPADLADSLNASERKQLATLADQREPIGAIQRFFRDHAERFAGLSRHQVAVAPDIVNEYERNAGKPTQRGPAGEATYNVFPIARTAYRPFDSTPYLPGSSLKGSIRTAWLNHLNRGAELTPNEQADKRNAARRLQERLLGYAAGKFENDPFRHLGLADAHPEDDVTPPPTRVLYAIGKKKRSPREGERSPQELKTFLETVPDALPAAFLSELRLSGKIGWKELCDACNNFYQPQLDAELGHPVLGGLLDTGWRALIGDLLSNELGELINARQGFLLRVGRNSGAESVTLDGLRDIKILGKKGDQPTYRSTTTQKRFASLSKAGIGNLLPFGWLWVDACDDAHRHLSDALRQKLAARSGALREAHQAQLLRLEDQQEARAVASAEAARQQQAIAAAEQARIESEAARLAALASMSPNLRRIEEFKASFAARALQLRGGRERLNGDYHARARKLSQDALEGADWSTEEKCAAADAIAEWLPKVVEKIDKDQLKKLKLSALRGLA